MKYNSVPGTRLKVSKIGFGLSALSFHSKGLDRMPQARHLLNYALDRGINFFDTMTCAAEGFAETLVGESLKEERERIVIAAGFGQDFYTTGRRTELNPDNLRQACDQSLRRLRMSHVDIYQLRHPCVSAILKDDLFRELERLKKQGKIIAWGASLRAQDDWEEQGTLLARLRKPPFLKLDLPITSEMSGWNILEDARNRNVGIFASFSGLGKKSGPAKKFILDAAQKALSYNGVLSVILDISTESDINELARISLKAVAPQGDANSALSGRPIETVARRPQKV